MTTPPFVDPFDLETTAHHEAGHVVIAHYFGCTVATATVAHDAATHESGRVNWAWRGRGDQRVPILAVAAAGALAGLKAGAGIFGGQDHGDRAMSEPAVASHAAEHGVTRSAIRAEVDREVRKILNDPLVWAAVEAVAAAPTTTRRPS